MRLHLCNFNSLITNRVNMIIVFLYVIFHIHTHYKASKKLQQTRKYYLIATLCLESFLRNISTEKQLDYIIYKYTVCFRNAFITVIFFKLFLLLDFKKNILLGVKDP